MRNNKAPVTKRILGNFYTTGRGILAWDHELCGLGQST